MTRPSCSGAARAKRAIYTSNVLDFCRLHEQHLENGAEHAGIIVVPRQRYIVKQQIRLVLNLLKTKSAEDMQNVVLLGVVSSAILIVVRFK
jgi:hypothetical protein